MLQRITVLLLALGAARYASAQADVTLRFTTPATHFTESAPLGNGRLGAMVFGNPARERIALNEISLWSGGVQDGNRKDAYQYLDTIRALLLKGNNIAAQRILQAHFTCAGAGSGRGQGAHDKYGSYQTLGDLWIQWADTSGTVTAYDRRLHLDSALSRTRWTRNGVTYTEEVIVSAPAQAILVRLTASRPGALNFEAGLTRKERAAFRFDGPSRQLMTGTLDGGYGAGGLRYAAVLYATQNNGHLANTPTALHIAGATQCVLVITAGTDMNWPNVTHRGPDPLPKALRQTEVQPWPSVLRAHVADYQSYFNRCRLHLGDTWTATAPLSATAAGPESVMPTADRLRQLQAGADDPALITLYFNFGRYLLISSSRPGGMPANLQGLWAVEYQAPWNGDYHLNINLQMNYWLADPTGLSDCAEPLFRFLEQIANSGRETAWDYYRARGWVAHVISNPWGFTAPGEGAEWGSTLTCGAWLATAILLHYDYKPDTAFLRKNYPVLKGASRFFTDILIREPKHNWLVTAPSNSPENAYVLPDGQQGSTCMGPTIDMQIGRQLLLGTAGAADILHVDREWADSLRTIAGQLAPEQVRPSTGGIQEWLEDYKEAEPQHRHVSPLYGLHPYDEITPWATPELADAARKTLERRGDGGTGWSRAWKMAFWARLGDGDHAYKMLRALLEPAGAPDGDGAGTYPNLFDACPPFQIDGNFGAPDAISEFFVQSQGPGQVIRLLPALPSAAAFRNGRFKGVVARNGFVLDLSWRDGRLSRLRVRSGYGKVCRIASDHALHVTGARPTFDGHTVTFATTAGKTYDVVP
ncbi:MAG TPA: glycoside hydrolase family 95 protein [Dinghuibacter sp.]|uniref:glycoside hydrolase family 95 protein n=1 Tax=Dinghuibacter sp. TaxID=2024697 RepID=UPI002CD02E93|nr:glycoside hydrolase family 95 protein [Dinghuibacter sp.]HTJ13532.1 glycoside hydrolase family 95 protein [Dinghuibacter sp.]